MTEPGSLSQGSRSQQLRELRNLVLTNKELWGWGTNEGVVPWEDSDGVTMIALWQSEARALEENDHDRSGSDEGPIKYTVAELQKRIPSWTRAGCRRYGLEPRRGKILYSLTTKEFKEFITSGRPGRRKLLP